ncbi:MAG: InlB B-repeat-containing protein [Lachnospiraceae bacterium]|nr:InlB B-repeat-containing protein [Lachnospiraceae bacterium]
MDHLRKKRLGTVLFMVTIFAILSLGSATVAAADGGVYDLVNGSVQISNGKVVQNDKEYADALPTITSTSSSSNGITITAEQGEEITLRLSGVQITLGYPAILIQGRGTVTLLLEGENEVTTSVSGKMAAVQKEGTGRLTITTEEGKEGSLTANGGAAGIGGEFDQIVYHITISGNAVVTANGGNGAGIGGSGSGEASDITITGNAQVTAIGSESAAGIGGGTTGDGTTIRISENAKVLAIGGVSSYYNDTGMSIGGGVYGHAYGVKILDSAIVYAVSDRWASPNFTDEEHNTFSGDYRIYASNSTPEDIQNGTARRKESVSITLVANEGTDARTELTETIGVPRSIPMDAFSDKGKRASGWNTKADGTGEKYTVGQSVTWTENTVLYAMWEEASPSGDTNRPIFWVVVLLLSMAALGVLNMRKQRV